MTEKYFARVPFTYGKQHLDRGELCNLKGLEKDAQLVGLKYFLIFDPSTHRRSLCPNCGRAFATELFLNGHKRKDGGCLANTQEITRTETAELADKDPDDFKIEDPTPYMVPEDKG